MIRKPDTCEGCPLHTTGKGFVPDKIVENEEYLVYGEAPGTTEISKGEPFVGKAGFVLRQWLMKAVPQLQIALEKNQISFCNVLKCLPPEQKGRPYPTGDTRRQAEEHCHQYAPMIRAKTVILCGEVPQRHLFGSELEAEDASDKRLGHDLRGVMGRVGRDIEKDGKRYVFAPHPAFILRQPSLVGHGQQALQIAAGTDCVLEPEYKDWELAMRELQ